MLTVIPVEAGIQGLLALLELVILNGNPKQAKRFIVIPADLSDGSQGQEIVRFGGANPGITRFARDLKRESNTSMETGWRGYVIRAPNLGITRFARDP